ncbi:hypothetical protein Caci_7508 [Catenulispora acidiphila DSM 44928]|uniref:Uncharacterized protein n=1 Tax=Catenulispora acidiphila (strain DSM 44928 / JCM 14897 / NBRC 102108 / NRRL B-24433 / ID139908) TaxID=479433 RepID=C7QB42_CATAD|nr:hypothetical protein Caci_7508 [Catenulispora acidiphila DSM 44928]
MGQTVTKGTDSFAFPSGGTVVELASSAECPPEIRERALRALAARARDAEDARQLMEALGLVDTPPRVRPTRRRGRTVIRSVGSGGERPEPE